MDLLNNLAVGFATALSLQNLLYCFLGVTLGTLIGRSSGPGAGSNVSHAAADHLHTRSDFRTDYARRHLLRLSVRRINDCYFG